MLYSLALNNEFSNKGIGLQMKLIVFVLTLLALSGCKTTPISEERIVDYGDGVELPEWARPNEATKQFYLLKHNEWMARNIKRGRGYKISPAGNAQEFEYSANPTNKKLEQEFKTGSLLSYLYYDDGIVKYDGLPQSGRFEGSPNDDSYLFTHSTGKSITSYIVGHAICAGHIESIDEPVDWPIMSNTLYQGQALINLLNMAAGDGHLVQEGATRWRDHANHHRDYSLRDVARILDGTEKRGSSVFYNNTLTDLIANYTEYKAGKNYDALLKVVFQDKAKIQRPVYFEKTRRSSYSYWITRKDLLRVGIAMMNDYQSGNCVGQYFRDLQSQKKRWPKFGPSRSKPNLMNFAAHYGGQFYWNFFGMKDRNVLGTDGFLGQNMLIDLDNSRIVVTHAIAAGWDVRNLQYNVIKHGELPK